MARQICKGLGAAPLLAGLVLIGLAGAAEMVPARMVAARVDATATPGTLQLVTMDVPVPAAGQVLLRVYAASANPSDWGIRTGPPREPPPGMTAAAMRNVKPGNDVSGVIVALGTGVTGFAVGDKVVAALQPSGGGAFAEYAVANADNMALKPRSFTFEQAAGMPTAGFTGLRMVNFAEVKRGERVLVIGAAGGVGSAAVQAAKARGAIVISSASSRHVDYLRKLGVDEIISYDKEDVAARARDIDVVINSVGTENAAAMGYVKRGGRVVNIGGVTDPAACQAVGITCRHGGPGRNPSNGGLIRELARMAEAGQFSVVVDRTFPLSAINDAFTFGRAGNREGKIAIAVRPDSTSR